jgi:hypothetical protein
MTVLQTAGRSGPVPELAFYYKQPVGHEPPLTFQDQVAVLCELGLWCQKRILGGSEQDAVGSLNTDDRRLRTDDSR